MIALVGVDVVQDSDLRERQGWGRNGNREILRRTFSASLKSIRPQDFKVSELGEPRYYITSFIICSQPIFLLPPLETSIATARKISSSAQSTADLPWLERWCGCSDKEPYKNVDQNLYISRQLVDKFKLEQMLNYMIK